MTHPYRDAIFLIERLHRHFLEVVKVELDRANIEDINNVQALILYNIGQEELTVGELTNRGYYLGSNVSYNVKKMVENGYLANERSTHDRRSVRLRLSPKGLELLTRMSEMFTRQIAALGDANITEAGLKDMIRQLQVLEQFWTRQQAIASRRPANFGTAAA
ncbi:MAG TPA: winged helix DNA-binding protein [Alphaproteobacteria bacterium]|nr:winged helix DNA-binding protein [Alphaproteobacteria bacterium]